MQQYTLSIPEGFLDNILTLKETSSADLRSNVLGWQSPQYPNTEKIPWAIELVKQCLDAAGILEPTKHVWFNVNGKGAYHNWHSHGGASVVGVLYIQVPKDSGDIEFKDGTSITPYPGLLLVFSAGLEHRVLANQSSEKRISLAFNINS